MYNVRYLMYGRRCNRSLKKKQDSFPEKIISSIVRSSILHPCECIGILNRRLSKALANVPHFSLWARFRQVYPHAIADGPNVPYLYIKK